MKFLVPFYQNIYKRRQTLANFHFLASWFHLISLCRYWALLSNRRHLTDKYTSNIKTICRSATEKHAAHIAEQVE